MRRKIAFSNKKKKAQLLEKRARKRADREQELDAERRYYEELEGISRPVAKEENELKNQVKELDHAKNAQSENKNKLTSQFDKLTKDQLEANKKRAMEPLKRGDSLSMKKLLEVPALGEDGGWSNENSDDQRVVFIPEVDIPVRPPWDYGMSREQVEENEQRYFTEWMKKIEALKLDDKVSLFEKNIEVWRQLWRVVEISDILLLVVDIRHPLMFLPPSLYRYIVVTNKKPLIVVLNKVDLVSSETEYAWKKYIEKAYPGTLVATFSCYKNDVSQEVLRDDDMAGFKRKIKKQRKRVFDRSRVAGLFEKCKLVSPKKDTAVVEWDSLISRYKNDEELSERENGSEDGESEGAFNLNSGSRSESGSGSEVESDSESEAKSGSASEPESDSESESEAEVGTKVNPNSGANTIVEDRRNDDVIPNPNYITLGLVGDPNVGKSTIINSIIGKTVVSTSRTPGHTKHFQTIHITRNLRLCDCPGLVFPCRVERPLQILMGLYNIAQVQEPYTAINYLAERVPIEKILGLPLGMTSVGESENERNNHENEVLSAWNITEQYATMRRYFTARNPRPDSYRAGIEILKLVFDGRLLLSFKPPGFYTGIGSGGDDQGLYKRGTDKNQDKTASTTAVLNSTAQANISDNIDFVDQRLRSVNIYDIMRVEDVDGNESGDSNNVSNDDYISHPPDTKPKDEGNITPGEKNTKNKSESKRSGKKTSGFVSNKFELLNS